MTFRTIARLSGAAMTLVLSSSTVRAQASRDSVVATVNEFFRAMQANDVASSQRIMLADGQLFASRKDADSLVVRRGTFESHFERLRAARDTIVERMWEPVVTVRDNVATLTAPYDLYRNGTFSHCGVDAFTLVRGARGWLITSVSYTVQPTGCAASPLGTPKR
jgi:hypothetical protein